MNTRTAQITRPATIGVVVASQALGSGILLRGLGVPIKKAIIKTVAIIRIERVCEMRGDSADAA